MVVCRSWPSTAGTVVLSPSGIRLPAPTSYFSLPSVPESALLKISSRPPYGLSVPMKPTRLAAMSWAG